MRERGKRKAEGADYTAGDGVTADGDDPGTSLDLFVDRRRVTVRAKLLQFDPFSGVAAVLLGGVTGHTRRPLGGVGPAFGALESDHDPDALVLGHGKDVRR